MSSHVTGLDLSLTASGVVTVRRSGEFGEVRASQRLIETPGFAKGARPGLAEWVERQTRMAHEVIAAVEPGGLVVIEAPSHGSRFGNPHERAGLWWRVVQYIVRRLDEQGEPTDVVVSVAPATRAKYAAGSGRADKRQVLAAVNERMPFAVVRDHNLADGLALAAMGWRWLGRPIDGAPTKAMTEAMGAVRWPTDWKGSAA